uniref:Uncharacterized protein n=1 Tax=Ciona intestinalis TaxID=7719 RepID=H2XL34_CIOIN
MKNQMDFFYKQTYILLINLTLHKQTNQRMVPSLSKNKLVSLD